MYTTICYLFEYQSYDDHVVDDPSPISSPIRNNLVSDRLKILRNALVPWSYFSYRLYDHTKQYQTKYDEANQYRASPIYISLCFPLAQYTWATHSCLYVSKMFQLPPGHSLVLFRLRVYTGGVKPLLRRELGASHRLSARSHNLQFQTC